LLFTEPAFLFLFLPLVLILHNLPGIRVKNLMLLVVSLVFYALGERVYLLVMIASIVFNYLTGLIIQRAWDRNAANTAKTALIVGLLGNLGMLFGYKYTNFMADSINSILPASIMSIQLDPIHLPIGISFFTFQGLSYVFDVYRRTHPAQQSLTDLGLYISLFPQLIAGPIVRYQDVADAIGQRSVTVDKFAEGIRRFSFGFAKKMLIANSVALQADVIFALPAEELTAGAAWVGAILYAIQIYFDFSGYSDMAIGLGLMLGFRFVENFNYPYAAISVTDFWRRWHISLSTWFRDYLYIPLGGNRQGAFRTYLNSVIVFLLCGLWHGASWTFVLWGLYHGAFLVIERLGITKRLRLNLPVLSNVYTMIAVLIGWVLFRANTVEQAGLFLGKMFTTAPSIILSTAVEQLPTRVVWPMIIGLLFAWPVAPALRRWLDRLQESSRTGGQVLAFATNSCELVLVVGLLVLGTLSSVAGTYNPFIYFRF